MPRSQGPGPGIQQGRKGPLVSRRVGALALLSAAPHSAFPTPGGAVCQTWSPLQEAPAHFHSEFFCTRGRDSGTLAMQNKYCGRRRHRKQEPTLKFLLFSHEPQPGLLPSRAWERCRLLRPMCQVLDAQLFAFKGRRGAPPGLSSKCQRSTGLHFFLERGEGIFSDPRKNGTWASFPCCSVKQIPMAVYGALTCLLPLFTSQSDPVP